MRNITPRNDADITSALKSVPVKNEAQITIANELSGQVWNNTYEAAIWQLPDAPVGFAFEVINSAASMTLVAASADFILVSGIGTGGQIVLETINTSVQLTKITTNLWRAIFQGTVTV